MPGGGLQMVEIVGPNTFYMWAEKWTVFKTGCIMLGILRLSTLDKYFTKIKRYFERYGQVCWHLIYQTDVHFRNEKLEEVRREVELEHEIALSNRGISKFNIDMPWDACFLEGMKDQSWWRENLEEDAHLICSKAIPNKSTIGDDVPIAPDGTSGGGTTAPAPKRRANNTSTHASPVPPSPSRLAAMASKVHNVQNGLYTTNRKGQALCEGFQTGTCTELGRNNTCAKDATKSHQCAKCLSVAHGAHACTKSPLAPGQAWENGKGKGKGKGKKGKGKGKWR